MNYRRVFSPEFKRESASLVLDQGYSTRESSGCGHQFNSALGQTA